MHTAYCTELQSDTIAAELNETESNHVVKVLRRQEGDELQISNGKGVKAIGTIKLAHPKKCMVSIHDFQYEEPQKNKIHIAIAPTKNMDRLEWFVEKATEIGVDKITLLKCKNNERKVVKMERLEKIILSAMKQSQRFYLPELIELTPIEKFISSNPNGGLAHCYDDLASDKGKTSIKLWNNSGPLLIGPEGDFTVEEVELGLKNNYTTIDLGQNRLRTETAAILGLTALVMNRI
jgi:16S rRNA (uracil1498-N3)-methyltransferase|tara:strand:- start:8898 stop:9602 length:705 start_codon:yes stop_codon:yes gene_type:complete